VKTQVAYGFLVAMLVLGILDCRTWCTHSSSAAIHQSAA